MTDVKELPFCDICRCSSDLKWRRHVYTKAHQRACADFLSHRVLRMNEIRQRVKENDGIKDYCPFCLHTMYVERLFSLYVYPIYMFVKI